MVQGTQITALSPPRLTVMAWLWFSLMGFLTSQTVGSIKAADVDLALDITRGMKQAVHMSAESRDHIVMILIRTFLVLHPVSLQVSLAFPGECSRCVATLCGLSMWGIASAQGQHGLTPHIESCINICTQKEFDKKKPQV